MAQSEAAEAAVELADECRPEAIMLVESRQLITHPEKTRLGRTRCLSRSHEVNDIFGVRCAGLFDRFLDYFGPESWEIVVALSDWVTAIVGLRVEGHVLAEVVHPAPCSSFFDHVLLDDVLDPFPALRIGQVDAAELDGVAVHQLRRAVLVHDEVAFLVGLLELVGVGRVGHFARDVREVRVDVDQRPDVQGCPVFDHLIPVRVVASIELPVPLEPLALREGLEADPVLHPERDYWHIGLDEQFRRLIDHFLSALERDDRSVHDPLGECSHCSNFLGMDGSQFLDALTVEHSLVHCLLVPEDGRCLLLEVVKANGRGVEGDAAILVGHV